MQGGIEEEEVEWVSSSDSSLNRGEAAADSSESSAEQEGEQQQGVHLAEIADVVLREQREREDREALARRVARAGGIELVAARQRAPGPQEDPRARARDRERRQLEIARRFREARRQVQNRVREERRRVRAEKSSCGVSKKHQSCCRANCGRRPRAEAFGAGEEIAISST